MEKGDLGACSEGLQKGFAYRAKLWLIAHFEHLKQLIFE